MTCYSLVTLYQSKGGPSSKTGKVPLTSLAFGDVMRPVQVPCGRCIGCRLDRSRQWAIRCMHEAQKNLDNTYITLTYRQDELVYGGNITGTLYPRHLTLFFKRLRKKYGAGIRYFSCGEYGTDKKRPHYHAIIFGFEFPDKKFEKNQDGFDYFKSEILNQLWTHGDCTIGAVTFESCAYVARYICEKKLGDQAEFYTEEGIHPEFVRMSRRPGIGSDWYDAFKTDLHNGYCVIRGGLKSSIPRYYQRKMELDNPELLKSIKAKAKLLMEEKWDENSPARLKVKQHVKLAQIRSLRRNKEL